MPELDDELEFIRQNILFTIFKKINSNRVHNLALEASWSLRYLKYAKCDGFILKVTRLYFSIAICYTV